MTSDKKISDEELLLKANDGNQPSESYLESLNVLDNVVRECINVSGSYSGISSPSGRHFYASVLFTSLITRGVSLVTLAPHSPWADKMIEHWDYATAAVIARTMMELRAAFHYLCVDPCTDDEWDCRWNVLNLHDCTARKKLFDATGNDPEQVAGFEAQAEELRERLKANAYFTQLGQQKKLLNGQTAYLYPIEELAERAGIEKGTYRWLHVLFSSHVHGLPMSYFRMGGDEVERGRGLPSPVEESYTSLCLSLASSILVATRDEVHSLFDGMAQS